jgi:hypothetical protein
MTFTFSTTQKITLTTQFHSLIDSHGNLYSIDNAGNVTAKGTPQNPAGIAAVQGQTAVVTFANTDNSKYSIDPFDAAYDGPFNDSSLETIEMAGGVTYRVPAKLMVQDGGDDVVLATVTAPGQFDPDKLMFKTFTGQTWESTYKTSGGAIVYTVTIKPGNPNGATTLMALYNSGAGDPELVGKLKVYTYAAVNKDVVLVPVGGASVPSGLASELTAIYSKYGVNLDVTTASPYDGNAWDTDSDGLLDCTSTTRLSRYSAEMKALNAAYRLAATTAGTYKQDAQYLFFLAGAKTDESLALSGDMPRGKINR